MYSSLSTAGHLSKADIARNKFGIEDDRDDESVGSASDDETLHKSSKPKIDARVGSIATPMASLPPVPSRFGDFASPSGIGISRGISGMTGSFGQAKSGLDGSTLLLSMKEGGPSGGVHPDVLRRSLEEIERKDKEILELKNRLEQVNRTSRSFNALFSSMVLKNIRESVQIMEDAASSMKGLAPGVADQLTKALEGKKALEKKLVQSMSNDDKFVEIDKMTYDELKKEVLRLQVQSSNAIAHAKSTDRRLRCLRGLELEVDTLLSGIRESYVINGNAYSPLDSISVGRLIDALGRARNQTLLGDSNDNEDPVDSLVEKFDEVAVDGQTNELRAEIAALKADLEHARKLSKDTSNAGAPNVGELQAMLMEQRQLAAAARARADDAIDRAIAAQNRANSLEKDLQVLQAVSMNRVQTNSNLSENVVELHDKITELEAKNQQLQSEYAKATAELNALRANVATPTAVSATLATENLSGDAQEQVAQLQAKLQALQAEKEQSDATMKESIRKTKIQANEQFEKLKGEFLTQMDALNQELQNKVTAETEAASKLAELQAKLDALQSESSTALAELQKTHQAELVSARKGATLIAPLVNASHAKITDIKSSQKQLKITVRGQLQTMQQLLSEYNSKFTQALFAQTSAIGELSTRYKREMAERKRLFNLVQELRGNIRVYCRVRPALETELTEGNSVVTTFPADGEISIVNSKKKLHQWEFDHVFRPEISNSDVFKEVEGLITSAIDGYNVCIFAYGQTGSGKTFTMEGIDSNRGVNYRSLETLFNLRKEKRDILDVSISVAMLEIYNEEIRDMLVDRSNAAAGFPKLSAKEGPNGMYVPDLTIYDVEELEDVLEILNLGAKNRTTFATNMNEHSSRSHAMLSVYIKSFNKIMNTTSYGKLHLIDLAGSERVSRSGATGDRLKEAAAINKSLSALGDVIQARAEKKGHVPFRNSTLTYLLSDSLSGDSKTLMFVNVSPVASNADETVCSLNFASRVRSVELGRASKNVSSGSPPQDGEAPAELSTSMRRPVAAPAASSMASRSAAPRTAVRR